MAFRVYLTAIVFVSRLPPEFRDLLPGAIAPALPDESECGRGTFRLRSTLLTTRTFTAVELPKAKFAFDVSSSLQVDNEIHALVLTTLQHRVSQARAQVQAYYREL